MRFLKGIIISTVMIGILLGFSFESSAIPSLQLYIPGATYDTVTDTWMYPGLEYDLWAIGAANKKKNSVTFVTIEEVKIAAAVKKGQTGTITIQQYLYDDELGEPLVPSDKFFNSIPVKGDEDELPRHGIYPSDFYEFELGDFVLDVEGIPNFTEGYDPDNPVATRAWGKIMKYHVSVTGEYNWVHFDLYDHIIGDNSALFAPFSHDAHAEDGGGGTPIPEPATLFLLGTGLIGLGAFGRKKFKKFKSLDI